VGQVSGAEGGQSSKKRNAEVPGAEGGQPSKKSKKVVPSAEGGHNAGEDEEKQKWWPKKGIRLTPKRTPKSAKAVAGGV